MMINAEDRHGVIVNEDDDDMIVREIMKMLMYIESIAGWGVVPRMAPSPSQGGSATTQVSFRTLLQRVVRVGC